MGLKVENGVYLNVRESSRPLTVRLRTYSQGNNYVAKARIFTIQSKKRLR